MVFRTVRGHFADNCRTFEDTLLEIAQYSNGRHLSSKFLPRTGHRQQTVTGKQDRQSRQIGVVLLIRLRLRKRDGMEGDREQTEPVRRLADLIPKA